MKARKDIEETLAEMKAHLATYEETNDPMQYSDMDNCKGWIEALSYVLGRIDAEEEEE